MLRQIEWGVQNGPITKNEVLPVISFTSFTGSIRVIVICHDQKFPKQMKKYLSVGENKEELVKFLRKDWSSNSTGNNKIVNRYLYSKD